MKAYLQVRRLLACLSPLVLALPVLAAPNKSSSAGHSVRAASDEEVIVSADPLRRADEHLIQPFTVIGRERLMRENLRNIGEAVNNELGVNSSDFGAGVGRPVIRGLSGARVQVLDDGIGSMDVSTLSPDHAVAITPVFARQVEIFRGPATLLYGSSASGGLVNVVDDRILDFRPERASGEFYSHYDTASEGKTNALMVETGVGSNFALHLDALKEDAESYEIPGAASRTPDADERRGRLTNSQSDHENFAGGLSWIGSEGFLGMSVQRMNREYGVPGGHGHHGHEHEDEHDHEEDHDEAHELFEAGMPEEEGGVTVDQRQTRFDVKGEWRNPLPGLTAARTRWGFNDHNHAEIEGNGEVGTQLVNTAHDGRFELLHQPLAGFTGVFGVQLQDRNFDALGEEAFVPESTQQSVAGFLVEERDFGPFHAELGLRFEHNEAEDLERGLSADFDVHAVSGGLNYTWLAGHEVGLSVTHAGRAPSIEELFAGGAHLATNTYEIGRTDLDVETSTNLDVYLRRDVGGWQLNLGFFYNDISDYIYAAEQDLNGDGVADRVEEDYGETGEIVDEDDALLLVVQDQRDARFWGFELESRYTVFDDTRGALQWRVWSDYVEARFRNGDRIPRIPALRFGTGLEWQLDAWSADVRLTRVADQDRTAALETATDGYTVLDLGLEYTLPLAGERALVLFARGNNLLDEEIRRHTSFLKDQAPMPGASGMLGFRCLF
jgi:iron complex outermembrane receptor protein